MSQWSNPLVARLEAMGPKEVEELMVRLVDFANTEICRRTRWMRRPFLPKGYDAETLASEALFRVLDTGGRKWDPAADPNLLSYLKSVARSILWDLQKAAEKEALDDVGGDEIARLPSTEPSIDERLAVDDLRQALIDDLESDDEKLVAMAIFDGYEKASEIAEYLGIDVERVYKLKWQIKRRLLRRNWRVRT